MPGAERFRSPVSWPTFLPDGRSFLYLARLDSEGCARYVVSDVNKDGMLQGPNLDLLRDRMMRVRALERFVEYYNHERPHLSLGGMTPVERRLVFFADAEV